MSSINIIPDEVKIHKTLVSINEVTLKIKRELEIIEELVKENGQVYRAVNAANLILSKKVQEIGLDIASIINEDKNENSLQSKSSSSSTYMTTAQP